MGSGHVVWNWLKKSNSPVETVPPLLLTSPLVVPLSVPPPVVVPPVPGIGSGTTPGGSWSPTADASFTKLSGMRSIATRPPFGMLVRTSRRTRAFRSWNAITRTRTDLLSSPSAIARLAGNVTSPCGVTRPIALWMI